MNEEVKNELMVIEKEESKSGVDKEQVKRILRYAARNKDSIAMLLEGIDEDNVEQGSVNISDKFVSTAVEEFGSDINEISGGVVQDCGLTFEGGALRMWVKIKKFVTTTVRYDIKVESFIFDSERKRVVLSYKSRGFSPGNVLSGIALKIGAIVLRKKKLSEKGVIWKGRRIEFLPDIMGADMEIPEWLTIKYGGCNNGVFRIEYEIKE